MENLHKETPNKKVFVKGNIFYLLNRFEPTYQTLLRYAFRPYLFIVDMGRNAQLKFRKTNSHPKQ